MKKHKYSFHEGHDETFTSTDILKRHTIYRNHPVESSENPTKNLLGYRFTQSMEIEDAQNEETLNNCDIKYDRASLRNTLEKIINKSSSTDQMENSKSKSETGSLVESHQDESASELVQSELVPDDPDTNVNEMEIEGGHQNEEKSYALEEVESLNNSEDIWKQNDSLEDEISSPSESSLAKQANDRKTDNPTENLLDNVKNILIESKVSKVEDKPQTIMAKTQVQISVDGNTNNMNWIKIAKPSNNVTLNDIKPLLLKNPKRYGMSNEITYQYTVKTSKGCDIGFEEIDEEDDIILPLFGDKIIIQCWSE